MEDGNELTAVICVHVNSRIMATIKNNAIHVYIIPLLIMRYYHLRGMEY